jgi:transcriptional regulator with XRE-family HTH domain
MILLRRLLGDVLRRQRQRQGRTLREVSAAARVSLGYLSEVERGQKEASSELLASICDALGVKMSELMSEVSGELEVAELAHTPGVRSLEPVGSPASNGSPATSKGPVGGSPGGGAATGAGVPVTDVVAAA